LDSQISFSLLGPLQVRRHGILLPVPPGNQRSVLAALLLSPNQLVSRDDLIEVVWGAAPPPSARVTLQNYVKRLRKTLADSQEPRVRTLPGGYLIEVASDELDVTRFEEMREQARKAADQQAWDSASEQLRAALSLWRGEPLADVPSEVLALRESPRLTEMWIQTLEARVDADLHLGRHRECILELRKLTALNPLRERLYALLMIALYRDGQRASALATYRQARGVLIEELATEPGPELQKLEQQILSADPGLIVEEPAGQDVAVGGGEGTSKDARAPIPHELPAAAYPFVGRAGELTALQRMTDGAGIGMGHAVVISAIGGTAGVGKTALAVHWAYQMADRYPDGQLYVNLRGYDPDQPVGPSDALAGLLRSLGIPSGDIPPEEHERSAKYRSLLAGRRMLIVLDNARSTEQVRPLLPGSSNCLTLITSRNSLSALVARDGAQRLELQPLPLADGVEILRRLVGSRVEEDVASAEILAEHCSLLPLPLRLVAELAAARPDIALATLAHELADQERRLEILDAGGDQRTAIRTVFSWSYRSLGAHAARVFRLLSLDPCPDTDRYAVAALTGESVQRAERALTELVRAHLIFITGQERYGMHDLIRSYARELVTDCDGENEARSALTRLVDHCLYAAALAVDALFPKAEPQREQIDMPVSATEPIGSAADARLWLDAHRSNLVTVAAFSAEREWPEHAVRLAGTLWPYLAEGAHYAEIVAFCEQARRAADRIGDRTAEAEAVNNMTLVDMRQGRYRQAIDHLLQAQELYRQIDNVRGQARCQGNLGVVNFLQGCYRQAVADQHKALELYRQAEDSNGETRALSNLGIAEYRLGLYGQAVRDLRRALDLARRNQARESEAHAGGNLGLIRMRHGQYRRAGDYLRRSLAIFQDRNDPSGEAFALTNLSLAELGCGRVDDALAYQHQSLALSRKIGDEPAETEALNGLGEVLLATDHADDAIMQHVSALALATKLGDKYEVARAHNGLGCCYGARGEEDRARGHWQQALLLYEELETPEAGEVRGRLQPTAAG
jgi:DNA-binding SARP family transcriptional activator/Tfp pilus assembly protein PilF